MGRSHLDVRHIATKGEGASVAHHNVTLVVRKVEKSNWFKFIEMRPSRVPNPGGEIDEKGEICSKLFSVKQNELTHLKVKVLRRHFQSQTTNLHILAPGHTKVLFEKEVKNLMMVAIMWLQMPERFCGKIQYWRDGTAYEARSVFS